MIIANGSTVTLKDSVGEGAIHSSETICSAINGGTIKVQSGTYDCTGNVAMWAGGKNQTGNIIVENGTVIGQEFAIGVGLNSSVVIEDGNFIAHDNAVIGGNGTKDSFANATITINGGEFTGDIQTSGYTGCGIYMPNSGTVNVNGGKFTVKGVGICARAGEININGGEFISTTDVEGWVGDKKIKISANGVYYDGAAKYPGLDETAKVNIHGGTFTNTTNTDIKAVKITQPDNGIVVQSDIEGWSIAE